MLEQIRIAFNLMCIKFEDVSILVLKEFEQADQLNYRHNYQIFLKIIDIYMSTPGREEAYG